MLIITGDHGHDWKETTPFLKDLLTKAGHERGRDRDARQGPDRRQPREVRRAAAELQGHARTATPETTGRDENKKAFADAVKGGKGLVVYHHASSAFVSGDDRGRQEFEKVIAGGWRKQGNHGKRHEFDVTVTEADHPITKGLPASSRTATTSCTRTRSCPDGARCWRRRTRTRRRTRRTPTSTSRWSGWRATARAACATTCWATTSPAMEKSPGFQALLVRGVEWAATGDVEMQPAGGLKPNCVAK